MKRINKINELERNSTASKILNFFYDFSEEEFSLNDVQKEISASKTTTINVIEDLVKNGWITKRTIGKLWRLKLNTENYRVINYKIVHNLDLIYGTSLIEFILEKYPMARAIILFGSYRKGDDISTSDIDIAIEVPGLTRLEVIKGGIIDKLGYRTDIPVNFHTFSRQSVNLNVFANIANGIILYGFLEVKP